METDEEFGKSNNFDQFWDDRAEGEVSKSQRGALEELPQPVSHITLVDHSESPHTPLMTLQCNDKARLISHSHTRDMR